MKARTILAIVAIVAALGAVTSLIPIHQVSAAGEANPQPNGNAIHACANGNTLQIPFAGRVCGG